MQEKTKKISQLKFRAQNKNNRRRALQGAHPLNNKTRNSTGGTCQKRGKWGGKKEKNSQLKLRAQNKKCKKICIYQKKIVILHAKFFWSIWQHKKKHLRKL